MEKKISVIIPCYNVQKELDRCVNSLVRQTIGIDALELIFVDDASTDGTLKRLTQWEKRFPQSILVVACEQNGRQGTARNIGLSYASAPYIGYVDADDWAELTMFEKLYEKAIESGAQVTACLQGRDAGDGHLRDVKPYRGTANELMLIDTIEKRHAFLKSGLPGGVYTKLYRRDFLLDNRISFPEGLVYEDNYFSALVTYTVERAYVLNEVLYHYYYNENSTVSARNTASQLDRLQIEKLKLSMFKERVFFEEFSEEIHASFLKLYYINSLHLIFTRFDTLPYEILYQMRETVLKEFPDYKKSRCYEALSSMEKGFLLSLEAEMTDEKWDNLAQNYRHLIKNKKKIQTQEAKAKREEQAERLLALAGQLDRESFGGKTHVKTAKSWEAWLGLQKERDADGKKEALRDLYGRANDLPLCGRICVQYAVVWELAETEYTNRFLEFLVEEAPLSPEEAYCLRWQIMIAFFPFKKGKDEKTGRLMEQWYRKIFAQVSQEHFADLREIKKEERDENLVFVFTSQFISIQHGPTKTVLDRVYTLQKKLGKCVVLINTAEYGARNGLLPLFAYNEAGYTEQYGAYTAVQYKDIKIIYLQLPNRMLCVGDLQSVVRLVQEKKPYFLLNVGGNSILSDLCSRLCPLLTISTVPSSLITTEGQYQMIGRPLTKKDEQRLALYGKTADHVITGRFTSAVVDHTERISRESFRIPDGRFVIVMVGGRLTYEVTKEFLQPLLELAYEGAFFVFAGKMEQYGDFCEAMPDFKENSAFVGMVKDIFSLLEHCDLYVNPPRTGGGTSSVEAMHAGIPVVTLPGGDVPTNVGEQFIVPDEAQMKQTIRRYMNDKAFYREQAEAARARAAYMMDTDGAFTEVLTEFYRRAGL